MLTHTWHKVTVGDTAYEVWSKNFVVALNMLALYLTAPDTEDIKWTSIVRKVA